MELLDAKLEQSSVNKPKLTREAFEVRNNYYVVTDGNSFNYYTIKTFPSNENSPLIRFEKSPPVILEGVAVVEGRVYRVTAQDLLRRVIRKSREVIQEVNNGSTATARTTSPTAATVAATATTVSNQDQSGTEPEAEVEIAEAANLAWSQQVGEILHYLSEKEGESYEISGTP